MRTLSSSPRRAAVKAGAGVREHRELRNQPPGLRGPVDVCPHASCNALAISPRLESRVLLEFAALKFNIVFAALCH